ncbi:Piso0_004774 [Millerozyma farinosa CBS 7064]|uniref:Piso0_004774 protein n=1 Tax=Pichia sorbitophila (strain ATCC MYA-4447 / BCRC 22081 / CBS 7064 / NBRC 10061 / NRRL Y-12695) TaxID=559304 RepID=G8Y0D8_PICSO|nr:Piso0_004774 [Millerozyma farinosa CBS 7064]
MRLLAMSRTQNGSGLSMGPVLVMAMFCSRFHTIASPVFGLPSKICCFSIPEQPAPGPLPGFASQYVSPPRSFTTSISLFTRKKVASPVRTWGQQSHRLDTQSRWPGNTTSGYCCCLVHVLKSTTRASPRPRRETFPRYSILDKFIQPRRRFAFISKHC